MNLNYHWQAFLLNSKLDKTAQAINNLNNCIKINPGNPHFYNSRAILYSKSGIRVLALDDYQFIVKRFGKKSLSKELTHLVGKDDIDYLPF